MPVEQEINPRAATWGCHPDDQSVTRGPKWPTRSSISFNHRRSPAIHLYIGECMEAGRADALRQMNATGIWAPEYELARTARCVNVRAGSGWSVISITKAAVVPSSTFQARHK